MLEDWHRTLDLKMRAGLVYPVPSLLNLSLYEVTNTKNLTTRTEQLSFLPPNLKDPLRKVLLKRGAPTEIIKSLIHSKIRSLDLSECEKTEEMLTRVRETCGHLRKLSVNCMSLSEEWLSLSPDCQRFCDPGDV